MNHQKWYCSVELCDQTLVDHSKNPYGSCRNCYKSFICSNKDDKHDATLLYNEGCREHHLGGYSICICCALEAFQKKEYKNYESGEERCICPICFYDFGQLKDLPNTKKYVDLLDKLTEDYQCSIEGCVAIPARDCIERQYLNCHNVIYGSCSNCTEFSICYRGIDEPEHDKSLLYNEGCNQHEKPYGISVCIKCATDAYKAKLEREGVTIEEDKLRCICPECFHDFGLLYDLV